VIYFVWVGIFSLVIISLFWAFANDVYTTAQGERLFVIVAFGASSGAVAGSFIAGQVVALIGNAQMLLLAAGLLLLTLLISNLIDRREKVKALPSTEQLQQVQPEGTIKKGDAYKLIFTRKYLLLIALLVLMLNWVNTNGEFILSSVVIDSAESASAGFLGSADELRAFRGTYISQFYGNFFFVVNLAGLLMQLFLVSRIIKYLGVRIAVVILPCLAVASYSLIALFPIVSIVKWSKTAENATDYSLNNTVRHILFLPTSREEKYKAKVAIDTLFQRAGDVLSAAVVFIVADWLMRGVTEVAMVNLGLVVAWLIIAYLVGKKYFEKSGSERRDRAV
jgi:AAA family ATP:ADP antiporter